jgi:predicted O-methyltransferase YrrM
VRGLKVGPTSFYGWNDGDAGFVRAIWRLIRHLRPQRVVETGVAHGMTSRFVLEALRRNDAGRLWSIDLPPFNPEKRREVGAAVTDALKEKWHYISGTSRYKLPKLLAELDSVDLFVHDSSHSEHNVTFELETVWPFLRPGGVIVVDDIDISPAFRRFKDRHPDHLSLICEAEPLAPDTRRFNQKGLFGILCRNTDS